MTSDKLMQEFIDEFHTSWNVYRVKAKPFRRREDFSTTRKINIIATDADFATIEQMNESGEMVRSVVPRSALSDFRR